MQKNNAPYRTKKSSQKEITPGTDVSLHILLVRGVISVLSYYLTSFGQPLFLQNGCLLFSCPALLFQVYFLTQVFWFCFFQIYLFMQDLQKTLFLVFTCTSVSPFPFCNYNISQLILTFNMRNIQTYIRVFCLKGRNSKRGSSDS